ncbi:MAG: hypothetical protein F6K45_11835 [Kamptonema sp. SIO1D9]|nr:hypothetical protein [Kamptonema sp. SIO1D9]
MSILPEKSTLIFPVELQLQIWNSEKIVKNYIYNKMYDGNSWKIQVQNLKRKREEIFGKRICLISHEEIPEQNAKKEEHIILQGLGTKWIKLPPGFVCDEINNRTSGSELALLGTGLMGALRPFYLTKDKEVSFTDDCGNKIKLRNHHQRGFEIEYQGYEYINFPESSGSGEIRIRIPVQQSEPLKVSRAIHKIAYLTFCVHCAEWLQFILQKSFGHVREFIEIGTPETYRPYSEHFIPGAPPGFDISFIVTTTEEQGQLQIQKVWTQMRLHHMGYSFSLVGDKPPLPKGIKNAKYYPKPIVKNKVSYRDITFGFDRFEFDD